MVVSSANIIKLNMSLAFSKSFMYIMKSKGPRIDPSGTLW